MASIDASQKHGTIASPPATLMQAIIVEGRDGLTVVFKLITNVWFSIAAGANMLS